MKDIFTNFYNKVTAFFKVTEQAQEQTKDVARNRLKLVLMQDRTNLTPAVLERMRGELINLLSKYVIMDKELLELNFEQEGEQMALMLSIPVVRAKNDEEIQEIIRSEEAIKNITLAGEDESDSEKQEDDTESEDVNESDESELVENSESEETEESEENEEVEEKITDEEEKEEELSKEETEELSAEESEEEVDEEKEEQVKKK